MVFKQSIHVLHFVFYCFIPARTITCYISHSFWSRRYNHACTATRAISANSFPTRGNTLGISLTSACLTVYKDDVMTKRYVTLRLLQHAMYCHEYRIWKLQSQAFNWKNAMLISLLNLIHKRVRFRTRSYCSYALWLNRRVDALG